MNADIKIRWIAALRSGEYTQTIGTLRNEDGYCCLGVLCDLYAKETGTEWKEDVYSFRTGIFRLLGRDSVLPDEVVKWAGLLRSNPAIAGRAAAEYNDVMRKTFNEIADIIEQSEIG